MRRYTLLSPSLDATDCNIPSDTPKAKAIEKAKEYMANNGYPVCTLEIETTTAETIDILL